MRSWARLSGSAATRFAIVSAASGVTNFGLTAFFHEIVGVAEELSYLLALAIALVQNFLGLRLLVYRGSTASWWQQFLQFVGATAGFRALEYLTFLALHSVLGIHYLVAVAVIMVVFTIGKYVFYGRTIFAR